MKTIENNGIRKHIEGEFESIKKAKKQQTLLQAFRLESFFFFGLEALKPNWAHLSLENLADLKNLAENSLLLHHSNKLQTWLISQSYKCCNVRVSIQGYMY